MSQKLRIGCIQMNMTAAEPNKNFQLARKLISESCENNSPDIIVLPEMWNTGFFPREKLELLCDENGEKTISLLSALASTYNVNIIGGSTAVKCPDGIFNTSYSFNRCGECISRYSKTHLFSPMGEHEFFSHGDSVSVFCADGIKCGVIICYDVRFPELSRRLALGGCEVLFIVSQWPEERIEHLITLSRARAIENQMFVCVCNSCAKFDKTQYGGNSMIIDPWGNVINSAGEEQTEIFSEIDLAQIRDIRSTINVFNDRRADIY